MARMRDSRLPSPVSGCRKSRRPHKRAAPIPPHGRRIALAVASRVVVRVGYNEAMRFTLADLLTATAILALAAWVGKLAVTTADPLAYLLVPVVIGGAVGTLCHNI